MTLPSNERWLPIAGYEGLYEASDIGRIRSLDRVSVSKTTGRKTPRKGKVLALSKSNKYLTVNLCKEGTCLTRHVHQLVAQTFVSGREGGYDVCHINGNPSDNRAANLRWGTRKSNVDDMIRMGTAHWQKMTHCKHGHEYTEENTYVGTDGKSRSCRTCRRGFSKRAAQKAKAERAAARAAAKDIS